MNISGRNEIKPTPRDVLNKLNFLQRLKKKFSNSSEVAQNKVNYSAEHLLKKDREIIRAIDKSKNLENLTEKQKTKLKTVSKDLLKTEFENSQATPVYHGNKTSLLSDINGILAQALNIGAAGHYIPLPRLQANIFEENVQEVLENEDIHDHDETYRKKFISASPTLASDIETEGFENALQFYAHGASISSVSTYNRISDLVSDFQLKIPLPLLQKRIDKIEKDFPQNGYIHQILFHAWEDVDEKSYPSAAYGRPLDYMTKKGKTSEFLSVLKSNNREEYLKYAQKYKILFFNKVQLRILATPQLFLDSNRVTLHCHRRFPLNESQYVARIRKKIIDPILEEALKTPGPGGLFALSPLATTLGTTTSLGRLVDYIFLGTEDPRVWVVNGSQETIVQALDKKQISPTSTFGTQETLLELSLLSKQTAIFQVLFNHFKNSTLESIKEIAPKLLLLCVKNDLIDATEYFLDYVNDPAIIKDLLTQACKKNETNLVNKIIQSKNIAELTLHEFSCCIISCLKNQNLEQLTWFLREYKKKMKQHDALHLRLLDYVVKYLPPEHLSVIAQTLENLGYDIKFLQQQLIYVHLRPLRYMQYYESLSEEQRLKLPLQKWWKSLKKQ